MKATENLYQYDEEFRNSLGTVDEQGKRVWIYPKKPHGTFHNKRVVVSILLLALFFLGPFIKIGGQPLLLLNFFDRRFVIFGQAFWPQDFFLLALTLIIFFVFVILFTVVFGRVWCGWACPQTVFMEMVFRKIEYWIEGDANRQRRLNQASWTANKLAKKTLKQSIFIAISILISHVAMAYLIGIEQVIEIVSQPPTEHLAGFLGLVAFTGIFYGVFAFFREQACIVVCPYGRLQGVLLGKESIVVAYDWVRGEPRRKIKKSEGNTNKGDCIDCKLCVHVCPTGIDIRHGTQLECVNCTACIDACDDVMTKIHKPKGLIRFASYNSIKDGIQKLMSTRVIGYSVILLVLLSLWSFLIFTRSDIETTVLKVAGTLYQRTDEGSITNLYNIEYVNKTFEDIILETKVISPAQAVLSKVGNQQVMVPAGAMLKSVYFIEIPADQVKSAKTTVVVGVFRDHKLIEKIKVKFIGPVHSHKDRAKGR
jgi:cytochrome c oxidase accessory protein FixG